MVIFSTVIFKNLNVFFKIEIFIGIFAKNFWIFLSRLINFVSVFWYTNFAAIFNQVYHLFFLFHIEVFSSYIVHCFYCPRCFHKSGLCNRYNCYNRTESFIQNKEIAMLQFLSIRMYCRFHILINRLRAIFYRVDIQVYNIRFIFLLNLDIWLAYLYEHISFLTFRLNKRAFKDNITCLLSLLKQKKQQFSPGGRGY